MYIYSFVCDCQSTCVFECVCACGCNICILIVVSVYLCFLCVYNICIKSSLDLSLGDTLHFLLKASIVAVIVMHEKWRVNFTC